MGTFGEGVRKVGTKLEFVFCLRFFSKSSPSHVYSIQVLVEVSFSFGKHLEEKHVTWAQFGKKQDKNATLQDFDGALDLQCVETASQFPLTS
ncbi:hypothetical protein Tco_0875163 [Tanacetum coccineum]|uniref:Uncharacterized protein n=1 Tax=Tanacetum coccineum TaxID=301880 RepID=A0ABQ5BRI0_9ASTR